MRIVAKTQAQVNPRRIPQLAVGISLRCRLSSGTGAPQVSGFLLRRNGKTHSDLRVKHTGLPAPPVAIRSIP
jgi:hypothetical protein